MKILGAVVAVVLILAGCATTRPDTTSAQAGTNLYGGEVWTWDDAQNIVTLRQGTQTIRVQTTPEEMRTLRLHEYAIVRGQLAPPAPIETVLTPAVPMTAVPRGAPEQVELSGTAAAADPKGLVTIESDRGRLVVWTATPGGSRYAPGTPVRVRTSVQRVDMVPAGAAGAPATPATAIEPAASVSSEPGDFAVVTGRVLAADSARQLLTVESPRGPVTVSVPNASAYAPGTFVQVRTAIHPGR
jgi:hypothetical protein